MNRQYDVALVVPPATDGALPSLAMSLFKASLAERGITSFVDYADLRFYSILGTERANYFETVYQAGQLGEYVFLPTTGWKAKGTREELFAYVSEAFPLILKKYKVPLIVDWGLEAAGPAVEQTAQSVAESGAKIVGVIAQFQQLNASAAILKRVKELRPDIVTMVGGAHCMDVGGRTILRYWPFADYVFFGEADEIFSDVCEKILAGEKDFPLPYGVLRHGEPIPDVMPHRRTQDLNKLPYPDFSDYFALAEKYPDLCGGENIYAPKSLVLEGSRGCWWGQSHPCTFCGLNGHVRVFHEKDPERLAEEFRVMAEKWTHVNYVNMSDSIMSVRHMKELPGLLRKKLPRKIVIMTETKSNLTEEDMLRLSESGIRAMQPGIESLHDDVLKLMNKGNTGLNHIALLRMGRKYRVNIVWNFLHGFPGEPVEAYEEMEKFVPLIFHLKPPNDFTFIQFHRSSVYCNDPEKYGLDLVPDRMYEFGMPDNDDYINGLGYIYRDRNKKELPPVYARIHKLVQEWRRQWESHAKEWLEMELFDDKVEIRDTRLCGSDIYHTLRGIKNGIYRRADTPVRRADLVKEFGPEADAAIDELIAKKLMVEMNGRVVALAVETTWKSKRKAPWLAFSREKW